MLDGKVIGKCAPRHRHQEFIRLLKLIDARTPPEMDLHIIVDNYATHKHPWVKSWLSRHPRFHFHFIPTSSSWLYMVERWFREITDKRIRRGIFQNVPVLVKAIMDYIENHNQNPKVFVWTAPVNRLSFPMEHELRLPGGLQLHVGAGAGIAMYRDSASGRRAALFEWRPSASIAVLF